MKVRNTLAVSISLGLALVLTAKSVEANMSLFAPPSAEALRLNGDTAAQWDDLRAQTIALSQQMRETAWEEKAKIKIVLSDAQHSNSIAIKDAFDTIGRRMDAFKAQMRVLREVKMELYNTMSVEEQAHVRKFFLSKMDRAEHKRAAITHMMQGAGTP